MEAEFILQSPKKLYASDWFSVSLKNIYLHDAFHEHLKNHKLILKMQYTWIPADLENKLLSLHSKSFIDALL